jgi:Ca-activated chloride channel family protein
VGDALLRAVGKRLRASLPEAAFVARSGEDEFAVTMPLTSNTLTARLTSSRILVGASDQNIAVTITAPAGIGAARPPLSLAVVIDRSGSMSGTPIQNAKAAAAKLIDQLEETDAFTVVTYSSSDETVVPMTRATPSNKAAAHDAIERIFDDGGTCISCGLTRGAGELAHSPVIGGLRRMVLISDGQANEGIWDRAELVQLAANTAVRGVSISTVGVGLDFDEITMTHLAEVGRGHYYFVENTRDLDAMFASELGGLADTVAADVRLVVTDAPGARIEQAYGYPITREGNQVIVPIADLRAGETRKVVLRATLGVAEPGSVPVATFDLAWRRTADGASQRATTQLVAEVVDDAGAVAASIDPLAVQAIEEARSSAVLEEAAHTYETQGAAAAQQQLRQHLSTVHMNKAMSPAALQKLDAAEGDAIDGFAKAPPAKAMKATRAKAYELAH